jgi:hypothetical protein
LPTLDATPPVTNIYFTIGNLLLMRNRRRTTDCRRTN